MNFNQIRQEFSGLAVLVIISRIVGVGNAVGTLQPRPKIKVGTALAAERIGVALAWFGALGAGDLRS